MVIPQPNSLEGGTSSKSKEPDGKIDPNLVPSMSEFGRCWIFVDRRVCLLVCRWLLLLLLLLLLCSSVFCCSCSCRRLFEFVAKGDWVSLSVVVCCYCCCSSVCRCRYPGRRFFEFVAKGDRCWYGICRPSCESPYRSLLCNLVVVVVVVVAVVVFKNN
jgi:hypothetical protein